MKQQERGPNQQPPAHRTKRFHAENVEVLGNLRRALAMQRAPERGILYLAY